MTIAEKLLQIKKLLFDTATPAAPAAPAQQAYTPAVPAAPAMPAAPPAPVSVDYTLLDGSKVAATSLAVGSDVLVNGQPAPAGTYVFSDNSSIVVDDKGKISQLIPAPVVGPEDTIEDMSTPQQMMAAMQKFDATLDPTVKIILKALMNYCFGYELRRAQEQLDTANAIAAYQTTMGGQVIPLATDITAMKAQFATQIETMKAIFEAVNELAGKPTAELPEAPKMKFAFLGAETPASKVDKFAETHKKFLETIKEQKKTA